MSLGMFCAIPLPFHIWDEKYTALMVASFPLVGAVVGALWWLVAWGLVVLDIPLMLAAAALTLAPFFIAGVIHLDGYMDASDALLSRRPLEDRLRILKDPLVGAFAVVMLVILMIFQFAAAYTVAGGRRYLMLLAFIPVISRCCSTLAILSLKHLEISNYTQMLAKDAKPAHKVFVTMLLLAAVGGSFLYAGLLGLLVAGGVILGYCLAMAYVFRDFKGVSGDLLGYSLVIGELCGLLALALIQNLYL